MKKVEVEILEDWGSHKKGDKVIMFEDTAKACAKHKVLKITKTINPPKKEQEK